MTVAGDPYVRGVVQDLLNRFNSEEADRRTAGPLFEAAWNKIKAHDPLFYIKYNRLTQARDLYHFARRLTEGLENPSGAAWQLLMPDIKNNCERFTQIDLPNDPNQLILVAHELIPMKVIEDFGRLANPYYQIAREAEKSLSSSEQQQIRDKHPRVYRKLKEDGFITFRTLKQLITLVEETIQVDVDTPQAKQGQVEMAWHRFFLYYDVLPAEERHNLDAVKLYLPAKTILLGDRLDGIRKRKECVALTARALARLVCECSEKMPIKNPYAQGKHIQKKFLFQDQCDFALASRRCLVDPASRAAYYHGDAHLLPVFLTRAFLEVFAGNPVAVGYCLKHFMGLVYFSPEQDDGLLAKAHVVFNLSFEKNPINITFIHNILLFFTEFFRCSLEYFFQNIRETIRYYRDFLPRGRQCRFLRPLFSGVLSVIDVFLLVPIIFSLKALRCLWYPFVEPMSVLTDIKSSEAVTIFKLTHAMACLLFFKNASHALLTVVLEGENAMPGSSAMSILSVTFLWEKLAEPTISSMKPVGGIVASMALFSLFPRVWAATRPASPEPEERQYLAH